MTEYNFDAKAVDVSAVDVRATSAQDASVMASEGTDFNHTLEPQ
jgi:hypothetical protein